jgi:calcium-dependent protein kinase
MFFFFAKRNCCFFIRYCTGGELFDKIKSMNFFSEKLAADYMKQILSAIVYCHSKSIVHRFFFFCLFFDSLFVRDLKPENLLLESKKSNSPVKVIDFGTSRKFSSNIKMSKRLGTVLIYFYGFYLLLFLTLFF